MRILCATNFEELAPYADDWDRLAAGVPFRGWTWLRNWWRHYGPQNDAERSRIHLAVLCIFDDSGALLGVAPWYVESTALHGRMLRLLGSGEVCSDYLGVLSHPAAQETVVEAIIDYLAESMKNGSSDKPQWDLLKLEGIDAKDRIAADLIHGLALAGCTIHYRSEFNFWRLDLPGDWESYVASLGKHMRREVRRLERAYLDTGLATLHTTERLDELPEAMNILVELHRRRRTMLCEEGCFASPRFLGFFNDVVPELLRRGQAQLFWLEIDGRPAAAEYHLIGNGILYAYQSGVEPTLMEHQPGKLIYLAILRKAIEQGYRAFDFLRGDEPYKARFGAKPRPCVEYRAVPCRTVAQLRHGIWLAGKQVKRWAEKGMGIKG